MTTMLQMSSARDRILAAAIALFSAQGYHQTDTRDIAHLADVGEVTLFRCFESKYALFLSALRFSHGTLETSLWLLRKGFDSLNAEDIVPRIISTVFNMISDSPELVRLSLVAWFEVGGEARDECYAQLAPAVKALQSLVAANMESSTIRQLNPAIAIAGMTFTAIAHTELRNGVVNRELSQLEHSKAIDEYSAFWATVLLPSRTDIKGADDSAVRNLRG
jgi:AcrR family transcriptional regulator